MIDGGANNRKYEGEDSANRNAFRNHNTVCNVVILGLTKQQVQTAKIKKYRK